MTNKYLTLTLLFTLFLLSACAQNALRYQVDPEITLSQQLKKLSPMIAISVEDKRLASNDSLGSDTIRISGPENEAQKLKRQLVNAFKNNQYRIISNPLLADLAIQLQINELSVKVKNDLFKSDINIATRFHMLATRQGKKLDKSFSQTLTQEVANPVNDNDVTGVVNQLLSKILSDIIADPELITLAATPRN